MLKIKERKLNVYKKNVCYFHTGRGTRGFPQQFWLGELLFYELTAHELAGALIEEARYILHPNWGHDKITHNVEILNLIREVYKRAEYKERLRRNVISQMQELEEKINKELELAQEYAEFSENTKELLQGNKAFVLMGECLTKAMPPLKMLRLCAENNIPVIVGVKDENEAKLIRSLRLSLDINGVRKRLIDRIIIIEKPEPRYMSDIPEEARISAKLAKKAQELDICKNKGITGKAIILLTTPIKIEPQKQAELKNGFNKASSITGGVKMVVFGYETDSQLLLSDIVISKGFLEVSKNGEERIFVIILPKIERLEDIYQKELEKYRASLEILRAA